MRIEQAARVPRADLAPVPELLDALRAEWAELEFAADGTVVDPLTGESSDVLAIIDGEHRAPGSAYCVTDAGRDHLRMTLTRDDDERFTCSVVDGDETWQLDIDLVHAEPASIRLSGSADLSRLGADGEPGLLVRRVIGRGEGRVVVVLDALAAGGPLVDASGAVTGYRANGRADVAVTDTTWATDVRVEVEGRGLGRLVLATAGRRIQRRLTHHLAAWLEALEAGALTEQLERARAEVEEAGSPRALVREALWGDREPQVGGPAWPTRDDAS